MRVYSNNKGAATVPKKNKWEDFGRNSDVEWIKSVASGSLTILFGF